MPKPSVRQWIAPGIMVLLLVLAATGVVDGTLGRLGLGGLANANEEYLDQAFERSLKTFGVLSAVKVALAIVEGADIGVGFSLQIGDAVQATYDYVDIAWRTVLAGGVVIVGLKYLLQMVAMLDQWVLTLTLALALVLVLLRLTGSRFLRLRQTLRAAVTAMTVVVVSAYVLAPLSVQGASVLSRRITRPSLNTVEQELSAFSAELDSVRTLDAGLFSALGKTPDHVRLIGALVMRTAREASVWCFRIIAGYLFDCLVFPLGLLLLLVYCTRWTVRLLYGYHQSAVLQEDLDRLLRAYFGRKGDGDEPTREGERRP